MFYNNLFFLKFVQTKGGLAHPDSYREARAVEFIKVLLSGGLAQLARAFDWQSKGQEFDSPNLHFHPP